METEQKYKCGMCKSYYKPTIKKSNNNIYKTCDRCRNITNPKQTNTIQDLQQTNEELLKQIEDLKQKKEISNIEQPKRDEKLEEFLKAFQVHRI